MLKREKISHRIIAHVQRCIALLLIAGATGCAQPAITNNPITSTPAPTSTEVAASSLSTSVSATSRPTSQSVPTPTPSAAPAVSPEPLPSSPSTSAQPEVFSGPRALADVRWLANEIGSRPAGSEAEQRAANALAAKLQALGYTVQLQSFSVSRFEDRGSTLEVSAATPSTPSVAAIVNSASGTAQGPLVSVELGRTEDLAGRDVRGAIALIARGEITFAEKVRNVAEAGAIGALIYNQEPGSFQGTMADPAAIPAVALSGTEGAQIVQLLQTQQLTATLTVDAGRVDSVSQNVVATLPGSRDERLVLGAHYDSVAEGPGANDNASGTATVLELARVLPTYDLPYTVDVVLFGSEEIGLVGSRHYVESLALEERERIIGMLNFDMVGVGEEPMVGGTAELVAMVTDAAAQAGVELGLLGDGLNGRSDHASFLNAGIPALFFYRSDDPNYHTANDQATYVDGAHLEFAGRLALAVLTSVEELAPAAP